jgi:DNA-binding transcriptional LysR family regulator
MLVWMYDPWPKPDKWRFRHDYRNQWFLIMDRLTSMSVFAKVAEVGSFAAAAELFGLSPPMVGKHVRALEERLGARLINRTTRRQSLTEFGRVYYERCKLVLAEADAADALADELLGVPRGPLRVSVPVLFGRRCVVPVLLKLARLHPELELNLSFSDRPVDLIEDGFDLAIRNGATGDGVGLISRRVARQRMTVCASPAYLDAYGAPRTISELEAYEAIIYSRSGRARSWLFPQGDGVPIAVTPRSRLRLDDLEAIADAAVAGMGLAWLPCWLVRDHVTSGALVRVLADAPNIAFDSHALWLQTPHLPLRIRLAIDALAAELPKFMD